VDDLEKDSIQSDISISRNKNISPEDAVSSSGTRPAVSDSSAVNNYLDRIETDNRLGQLDKVLCRNACTLPLSYGQLRIAQYFSNVFTQTKHIQINFDE
jgi:hypothetical protein